MRLIITLLVKNEENIIEENLIFHKKMGVDGFIVTDNNSTDKTKEILEKYRAKKWIYEIINEPAQDFNQYVWVNRMIKAGIEKYNGDWIINSDADEFWFPVSRNIKNEIRRIEIINYGRKLFRKRCYNVINCYWTNMISDKENQKFWENTVAVVNQVNEPDIYNSSEYNIYNLTYPKVIHKTKGFQSIEQGNHDVKIEDKKEWESRKIRVYHFSIQNFEHFEKKVITGGQAYERNTELPTNMGVHWRQWYKKYNEGNLFEEYLNIIGREHFKYFFEKKYIENDYTIFNFFNKMKQND